MNKLYEGCKVDIGLEPQVLDNSNVTGRYFSMKNCRRALAILTGGAMAATKVSTLALYQATDALGSDSKAITNATATVTANTLVTSGTVELTAVGTGDLVTINGIEFTKAGATSEADREFANAAGLVLCVNHATYGVSGVTASANGTLVTLIATDPGATAITVAGTNVGGTVVCATLSAQAYVEADHMALDHANGFTHVACKVTTTANSVVSVVLLRGDPREAVGQIVGASAAV